MIFHLTQENLSERQPKLGMTELFSAI